MCAILPPQPRKEPQQTLGLFSYIAIVSQMKHSVVYIPGLGDNRTYGQHIALHIWRLFGLRPAYLALGWEVEEGLNKKLTRLDSLIEKLQNEGFTISLVGVSAGASAVLNCYANNPRIHKVVLVCGKVNNPDNVHPRRYKINPDFKESMQRVGSAVDTLQRQRRTENILSIYSPNDTTVSPKDSEIEGTARKKIFAWSHSSVIMNTLLFQGFAIAKFIKA